MEQVDILCVARLPADVTLPPRFRVVEGYDEASFQSVLAGGTKGIRGLVTSGGHKLVIDDALLAQFPDLEIVSVNGVGYDKVDVAAARKRKVEVTNTPDVLTDEVADLTVGLLLATIRRIPAGDRYVRDGKWISAAFPLSGSLRGRSVGIVGLGRIGQAVATRLSAFGVPVSYCGRNRQQGVDYPYFATPAALAEAVDILIVMTAGGASTSRLIDADVLEKLGPNGILINTSRGSVVEEAALVAALETKRLFAAGLDVYDDEPRVSEALIRLDNVVLLPHVGSATTVTRRAMGQLVADNLSGWFSGKSALSPVP